ncbi:hypothetical protein ACIBG8_28970 [Nonomuraea sp. NPDC050556]|uniref:hypothetical protein n=1 Tax=Nonomuraea sp. NPDC050556 TaxID=3364369 RepID=UPI003792590F
MSRHIPLFRWCDDLSHRRGQDPEQGDQLIAWVVIAAAVFLLAVAVVAKITEVVNSNLDKIGS